MEVFVQKMGSLTFFVSVYIPQGGRSTLPQEITRASHFCREFKALYPNCTLVSLVERWWCLRNEHLFSVSSSGALQSCSPPPPSHCTGLLWFWNNCACWILLLKLSDTMDVYHSYENVWGFFSLEMKKVVEVTSLWILFCVSEPIIMCYLWIVLPSRRSSLSVWDRFMNGRIGLKLQKKQVMLTHVLKGILLSSDQNPELRWRASVGTAHLFFSL